MKPGRFTESQIIQTIKEFGSDKSAVDICRELGITRMTFYKWRQEGFRDIIRESGQRDLNGIMKG